MALEMAYIIGSGPSGVAAAQALLDAGQSVTMLDVGLSLEASTQRALERTSSTPATEWNSESLTSFKAGTVATATGIPLKLAYGSDFPYRDAGQFIEANEKVGIVPSLARGGLSNVWGAAMLPYLPQDTADWPIDIRCLAPHYRAALKLTGLAGDADGLQEKFPLFGEPHQQLTAGSQVKSLLADMEGERKGLNQRGVYFGKSRLGVAAKNQHGFGCTACKLCMFGCPSELIFNSARTLIDLCRNRNFTYRPNIMVRTFTEQSGGVEIKAYDTANKEHISFYGASLFVAAGTLSTTRLVLESLKALNKTVRFKDSQYFLLPLLRYHAPQSFDREEPTHTLAQAFIEIFDEAVTDKSIHLQVYGYNDLYRAAIKHTLGSLYSLSSPIVSPLLKRFALLQGYLHSDYSHSIEARLLPATNGALTGRLSLQVKHNPETGKAMKRLLKKLGSLKRLLRAVPLTPLLKMGSAGRGFHTGGSFPMSYAPGELETDTLGRPQGYDRVHIVDSSIFPSISASTITLTSMANAHRIATEFSASRQSQPEKQWLETTYV
jgi:choline dehydrogenase-like flavoprotein